MKPQIDDIILLGGEVFRVLKRKHSTNHLFEQTCVLYLQDVSGEVKRMMDFNLKHYNTLNKEDYPHFFI